MSDGAPPSPTSDVLDPRSRAQTLAFEDYRDGLTHDWTATLTILGFCLIPLFLVLDYFTMPEELLRRFALYRGLATGAALIQFLVLRNTRPSRWSFLHAYVFNVIVAAMIVKMTVDLGGFNSAYYAGLMLVLVAVNVLLPWSAVHSAVNALVVIGMYVIANAVWGRPAQPEILVNNLYFLSAMGVIACAISHTRHALIRKEFNLRAELVTTNESLERSRQELKVARDALWGEMEVAKKIQTALLPKRRTLGPWEIAALMEPAEEVGGDYYDLLETRHGEHWLAIGDVSGHGVESGLVMMMTQTALLTLVQEARGRTPSEVFNAANRVIRENVSRMEANRYMTLNVIRLNDTKFTVAGKHQDLLIFRKATGRVEQVENPGVWMGILPDTTGRVTDTDVPLAPGDVLLLFTDGVTEAANRAGEMYGQERLATLLAEGADQPLDVLLSRIVADVHQFRSQQDDDVTLLLLRRAA